MKKSKISFIVPVYNANKYLEKCLDSIVNQTLENIEIVCINDGSTDESGDILSAYQKKHPSKFKIINQQNSGVWKARKKGIAEASGEYTCFIDSDDTIDKDYGKIMYDSITKNNSDMAVCAYAREDMETGRILAVEMNKFGNVTIKVEPNEERIALINTSLWNKIYKTKLLKEQPDIVNPPKISEDTIILLLMYPNINSITFIDDVLYHYKVHGKSAINNISVDQIEKVKNGFLEVKDYYMSFPKGRKLIPLLNIIVYIQLGIAIPSRLTSLNGSEYNRIIKDCYNFLNENFSWRYSPFLKATNLFKNRFRTSKIYFVKCAYRVGCLSKLFKTYNFVTRKLRIDIKW